MQFCKHTYIFLFFFAAKTKDIKLSILTVIQVERNLALLDFVIYSKQKPDLYMPVVMIFPSPIQYSISGDKRSRNILSLFLVQLYVFFLP